MPPDPWIDTPLARTAFVVGHALLALWGLVDTFAGWRLFRATATFLGILLGLAAGGLLAWQHVPEPWWTIPLAALVGGILGGAIARVALVAAAALAGAGAAVVLAAPALRAAGIAAGTIDFALLGAALLGAVLGALALRPAVIVATSLAGGFRLVYGTAFLLGIGPNLFLLPPDDPERGIAAFLVADARLSWVALALAVAGIVAQVSRERRAQPAGRP